MNTFEKLTAPLTIFLNQKSKQIDKESGSKKLFFCDFILKITYAIVMRVSSLRELISDLETNHTAAQLGFKTTPYSTFRDGFSRFSSSLFRDAFLYVLKSCDWLHIEAVDEIGIVKLVDGSLFPTLKSMCWARYKKTKNAVRLHLELELNTMIPTEFIAQKANSSERKFLLSILKEGFTYVADRGYFSFALAKAICKAEAFFILRIKDNLKFTLLNTLEVTASNQLMPTCFYEISDKIVHFDNDDSQYDYRLVCFSVLQSKFIICTNRLDLTTLQIIMLYAYRWQIELLFKFLKRTLGGIHLFSNSENGLNIQFYVYMIVLMLKLRLKQICLQKKEEIKQKVKNIEGLNEYFGNSPEIWIKSITEFFYKYWKIGSHWLLHLKNLIANTFDDFVIEKLAKY